MSPHDAKRLFDFSALLSFIHFTPDFPMEGVAGLAASGVHEIPHGFFQQRLLVVLVPHSGSTKSFRK